MSERRFTLQAAIALMVVLGMGVAAPRAAAADALVQFDADRPPQDLGCPPKPPPPPLQGAPAEYPRPPGREELGALAVTTVRPQPALNMEALSRLARGQVSPDHPFRIGWWGDSHIAAGPLSATVAQRLRARGLTVGPALLPPTMGRSNVRLSALHGFCIGAGWSSALAFTAPDRAPVGPALIDRVASGGADSWLWLDLRDPDRRAGVAELELIYSAPGGGRLDLSVNDAPHQTVALSATRQSNRLIIRNTAEIATLKLQVLGGQIKLEGLSLRYAAPPQVDFDVFGLPSSTMRGWANADAGALQAAMRGQDYDVVVLEYGTNEAADAAFDADRYRGMLMQGLQTLRTVFPRASCLLIGPPDRGRLRSRPGEELDLLSHSRTVERVAAIQQQTASEYGCAFWNWQALMGGPGGSYGWALAEPPLMARDLTHMTPAGYRLTADALARSLGF